MNASAFPDLWARVMMTVATAETTVTAEKQ